MFRRLILASALLTLAIATACAVDAAALTPEASPTGGTVAPSATASTVGSTANREALLEYVTSLSAVSRDYVQTLQDVGVVADVMLVVLLPHLQITGADGDLSSVYGGFADRVHELQPDSSRADLHELHALITAIIGAEQTWIANYFVAGKLDDSETRLLLERNYYADFPIVRLSEVRDRISELLAEHNIPTSQAGYSPHDLRLTVLDEDFIDPNAPTSETIAGYANEAATVQAAIDLLMADKQLITVTASVAATGGNAGEWASYDFDASAAIVSLFPNYLRQEPTKCDYTWDVNGTILTQSGCFIERRLLEPGEGISGTDDHAVEAATVQAAIDLLMADRGLVTVTATAASVGSVAGDWAIYDFDPGAATAFLYPDYLRNVPTMCDFSWDANGTVVSQACP